MKLVDNIVNYITISNLYWTFFILFNRKYVEKIMRFHYILQHHCVFALNIVMKRIDLDGWRASQDCWKAILIDATDYLYPMVEHLSSLIDLLPPHSKTVLVLEIAAYVDENSNYSFHA